MRTYSITSILSIGCFCLRQQFWQNTCTKQSLHPTPSSGKLPLLASAAPFPAEGHPEGLAPLQMATQEKTARLLIFTTDRQPKEWETETDKQMYHKVVPYLLIQVRWWELEKILLHQERFGTVGFSSLFFSFDFWLQLSTCPVTAEPSPAVWPSWKTAAASHQGIDTTAAAAQQEGI